MSETREMRPRPRPTPTPLSQAFWDATARGEFLIQRCRRCETAVFYPRYNCTACGSPELDSAPAAGTGSVYTFTIARRPTHPAFADRVPYVIAVVELDEGPHVTTNIVGCAPEDVRIGMPVEVTYEEPADGIALPLFRPTGGS